MTAVSTTTGTRTCAGTTKAGGACQSWIVGDDGYCAMHSPSLAVDPAELGRRGGLASGEVRREQAKSVRDRLREKVEEEFQTIAEAFDAGLSSEDERVRVLTAQALLAEAYGKPAVAIVGDEERPIVFATLLGRAAEALEAA